MINASATLATSIQLLSPSDKANTGAATGTGIDITAYEGYMIVTQQVGVVTGGTIVGKLQECDDAGGTGAADIAGATFTSAGTATDENTQSIVIKVDGLKPFLRYVGTIVTGPAVVGVSAVGVKKYN